MPSTFSLVYAALLLAAAAACSSSGHSTTRDGGTGAEGDGADASVDGRYNQGVYSCCAKGEGLSCCPPGSLPDPSIGRTATCFAYGGTHHDCAGPGEMFDGKDICSICCPGLMRLASCDPNVPFSVFTCVACGDGICGPGEGKCNCPEDCP
jgi:hypothetical protein